MDANAVGGEHEKGWRGVGHDTDEWANKWLSNAEQLEDKVGEIRFDCLVWGIN